MSFPPSPRPAGPLVMVLELESHMALTAARGLGREGVACLGVSYAGVSFGCSSRYLCGYAALTPRDGTELAERTIELIHRARPDFVMAATESVMSLLNARRDRLPAETKLLFSDQEVLDRAFDKRTSLRAAETLGIPVPREYSASAILESGAPPERASFPLVLKPPAPYVESPWRELDFRYGFCATAKELLETLRRFEGAPFLPLVQEYCAGRGVGVELCMHRNEVVAAFQHERVREMPPTGGVSVMRRSVALDPTLFAHSVRLLAALGWEGLAMVEYRRDDRTGRYWLMEVNGRLWGSICLPLRCGVNFPSLLLQSMGLDRPVPPRIGDYPTDVYCRALSLDLHRLMGVLRTNGRDLPIAYGGSRARARAVAAFARDFLRPTYYDVEWIEDPRPAIRYWRDRLHAARRSVGARDEGGVHAPRAHFFRRRHDPWIASIPGDAGRPTQASTLSHRP